MSHSLPFVFAFNVLCMTLLCKNNGLFLLRNFSQERDPLQEISLLHALYCIHIFICVNWRLVQMFIVTITYGICYVLGNCLCLVYK